MLLLMFVFIVLRFPISLLKVSQISRIYVIFILCRGQDQQEQERSDGDLLRNIELQQESIINIIHTSHVIISFGQQSNQYNIVINPLVCIALQQQTLLKKRPLGGPRLSWLINAIVERFQICRLNEVSQILTLCAVARTSHSSATTAHSNLRLQ